MEKRAILAAVLMAALLIVYQTFFLAPGQEPAREKAQQAPAAPDAPAPSAHKPVQTAPEPRPAAPPPARATEPPRTPARTPQRLVPVKTPLYKAVVSSQGGKLQELVLNFRGDKPMILVGDLGPEGLLVGGGNGKPEEAMAMSVSADRLVIGPEQPSERLELEGVAAGLRVHETLIFQPDNYVIEVAIRVDNTGPTPRSASIGLPWITRQRWPAHSEKFTGQHPTEIVWAEAGNINRITDLSAVHKPAAPGDWIALESVFYLAAFIPKTPGFTLSAQGEGPPPAAKNGSHEPSGRASVAVRATPTIPAGGTWQGRVLIYAGPKEYERLRALGLQETINFGGFPVPRKWGGLPMEWFGIPILLLMNWVYKYVGNYGIAIILLTVVSKVLFYPLTVKSMRSMRAMQALQPQINALRSKHKSDPQRVQRETMELYRKYKVNPMGGCLPMVAQIPIFYALYLALSVSVDLQNAKFLCFGHLFGMDVWICDLAAHDPTYVLPILMGITMFVQQKMTPTTGDPRQQKMMVLIMPAFFTMMFVNLASGLVLYWTVSNVLQVLQQWYMDRSARAARGAHDD